jgi:DNA-binding MarR family transcriptional regulator|tara:strand:- start:287 stop:493 length:207 start_codon:yes stop_codon:yes gene_type:complete
MILTLTVSGKRKAKDVLGKGIEQSILSTLEENGPATIEELSRDIAVAEYKVKEAAARLATGNYLTRED